ncbi:MAG: hypothetical protein KTR31_34495, partial [Myxococcales bacterium]|nr:hypothetical protein [Myxococcales bacterium]
GQEGFGVISLLLGEGEAPTHALTAGHLFPPGAGHPAEGLDGDSRWGLGTVVVNGLDQPTPRDVALVKLTAEATRAWQPQRGPAVTDVGDTAACVCVWTPRGVSRPPVRARPPVRVGVFEAPARPAPFTLRELLVVYPGRTRPGDSGALLLDGDRRERAVGLLVGTLHAGSFYEPLARALRTVRSLAEAPLQRVVR